MGLSTSPPVVLDRNFFIVTPSGGSPCGPKHGLGALSALQSPNTASEVHPLPPSFLAASRFHTCLTCSFSSLCLCVLFRLFHDSLLLLLLCSTRVPWHWVRFSFLNPFWLRSVLLFLGSLGHPLFPLLCFVLFLTSSRTFHSRSRLGISLLCLSPRMECLFLFLSA